VAEYDPERALQVLEPHGVTYVVIDAIAAQLAGAPLGLVVTVASLRDVIRMKEASGRAKDERSLPILRLTLEETNRREPG
jgi:hypothetical protein